ncbi:ribonuclease H-like domain-containing protein [Candidatus Woesearchaeota archaeon]|nr:ribonuclease H-like domain-containing protein [Candidatus Woesearchaeota archaeon]
MIRRTFLFLDRISNRTEQNIWDQGIDDWEDFIKAKKVKGIGTKVKPHHNRKLMDARKQLYSFNSAYFSQLLPQSEHWRLYEFFKEECCFIDIETSTVQSDGYITIVSLYNGIETKTMVRNINLDFGKLKQELKNYKMIVSFNGSVFDMPFLEKQYPGILPAIPHFDLRHACQRLGLKGGLKQIEKTLGLRERNKVIERIYNGDPLKLWRMYLGSGDRYYLHLLVEYNEEDVINLKPIADYLYYNMKQRMLLGYQ